MTNPEIVYPSNDFPGVLYLPVPGYEVVERAWHDHFTNERRNDVVIRLARIAMPDFGPTSILKVKFEEVVQAARVAERRFYDKAESLKSYRAMVENRCQANRNCRMAPEAKLASSVDKEMPPSLPGPFILPPADVDDTVAKAGPSSSQASTVSSPPSISRLPSGVLEPVRLSSEFLEFFTSPDDGLDAEPTPLFSKNGGDLDGLDLFELPMDSLMFSQQSQPGSVDSQDQSSVNINGPPSVDSYQQYAKSRTQISPAGSFSSGCTQYDSTPQLFADQIEPLPAKRPRLDHPEQNQIRNVTFVKYRQSMQRQYDRLSTESAGQTNLVPPTARSSELFSNFHKNLLAQRRGIRIAGRDDPLIPRSTDQSKTSASLRRDIHNRIDEPSRPANEVVPQGVELDCRSMANDRRATIGSSALSCTGSDPVAHPRSATPHESLHWDYQAPVASASNPQIVGSAHPQQYPLGGYRHPCSDRIFYRQQPSFHSPFTSISGDPSTSLHTFSMTSYPIPSYDENTAHFSTSPYMSNSQMTSSHASPSFANIYSTAAYEGRSNSSVGCSAPSYVSMSAHPSQSFSPITNAQSSPDTLLGMSGDFAGPPTMSKSFQSSSSNPTFCPTTSNKVASQGTTYFVPDPSFSSSQSISSQPSLYNGSSQPLSDKLSFERNDSNVMRGSNPYLSTPVPTPSFVMPNPPRVYQRFMANGRVPNVQYNAMRTSQQPEMTSYQSSSQPMQYHPQPNPLQPTNQPNYDPYCTVNYPYHYNYDSRGPRINTIDALHHRVIPTEQFSEPTFINNWGRLGAERLREAYLKTTMRGANTSLSK